MLARGKFPLLIKLIDANQPLSVQVHPSNQYAAVHENGELGKTEMWYILQAKPGAALIYGLKPGVSPQTFRAALEAGQLEPCLHYLPVKAGDAVFIPAGSVHAIMDGIVLAEIQQNSDTTYRVYDWNRLGADGRPRPLHIDKAMEVINFDQVEPGPFPMQLLEESGGVRRELISACPYFQVERVGLADGASFAGHTTGDTFEIWGTVAGHSQITWVGFGLIPAALGRFDIKANGPATLLRAYVPGE
jgi:mannose-6-phosphate isomerase